MQERSLCSSSRREPRERRASRPPTGGGFDRDRQSWPPRHHARALVGSVAEAVMREASCPVLVVRAKK
ncbi:universal stress protein [Mesorhizobium atlanticum]